MGVPISRDPLSTLSFPTQHDGVDDEPHDVLDDEHRDGRAALLGDHAAPEADGHLHLDGEQKGRGERPGGGRGRERGARETQRMDSL